MENKPPRVKVIKRPAQMTLPLPLARDPSARLTTFTPMSARPGGSKTSKARSFCKCIKDVRKTIKARKGKTVEGSAIAVCTTRLLWPHGKTLRSVQCKKNGRKALLMTQRRK